MPNVELMRDKKKKIAVMYQYPVDPGLEKYSSYVMLRRGELKNDGTDESPGFTYRFD